MKKYKILDFDLSGKYSVKTFFSVKIMELGCVREKSKFLPRMKQNSTAPSSLQCVLMPPKPCLPHVDDNILNEGLKLVRTVQTNNENN